MSWIRVWVHFVFSTKNSHRLLKPYSLRQELFKHMKTNAKEKNLYLDTVNGFEQHAHCLISLSRDITISKTMQLIKGESAFWFNHNDFGNKLYWQDDYWAASVSESHLERVRKYIMNQEEHHKSVPFSEEVDKFMKKYGWQHYK